MRKHLLILLALVAALSLVFVACDKTPDAVAVALRQKIVFEK